MNTKPPEKTKHDYDEVLRLYRELGKQTKVAERLGICQGTVSSILRRMGIRAGKGANKDRPTTGHIDLDAAFLCYQEGRTLAEVAEMFGAPEEALRRRMVRAGFPMRKRGAEGERNFQWKGGKGLSDREDSVVARAVAVACLGEPLRPGEVVHHMDENRKNNHWTNLWVFPSNSAHLRYHQQLLGIQRQGLEADTSLLAKGNGGRELPCPRDLTSS